MKVKYPSEMELFFSGVENEVDMKKRYRELIKIFHPDKFFLKPDSVRSKLPLKFTPLFSHSLLFFPMLLMKRRFMELTAK